MSFAIYRPCSIRLQNHGKLLFTLFTVHVHGEYKRTLKIATKLQELILSPISYKSRYHMYALHLIYYAVGSLQF